VVVAVGQQIAEVVAVVALTLLVYNVAVAEVVRTLLGSSP